MNPAASPAPPLRCRWSWRTAMGLVLAFGALAGGMECALTLASPEHHGLWDGLSDIAIYTWGHAVRFNRLGFRDREVTVPKPEGIYRIVVLGDETTWGTGLAEAERYTTRLEHLLQPWLPGRRVEVINAGLIHASASQLRDALAYWCETPVNPDLVVLGFHARQIQDTPLGSSPEREAFTLRHLFWCSQLPDGLARMRMPLLAEQAQKTVYRLAERLGRIPAWPDALARAYAPGSADWQAMQAAFRDLRAFCDRRQLPPPVWVMLNEAPDGVAAACRQAEHAAADAGFILAPRPALPWDEVPADAWYVNPENGRHPRHFQAAYARAVADALREHLPLFAPRRVAP